MTVRNQEITKSQATFLYAARCIAEHAGLIPWSNFQRIEKDVIEKRIDDYFLYGLLATVVIRSPSATLFQKSVAKLIIDCINPYWREFSTEEAVSASVISRSDPAVVSWRRGVLARDGYKCQNCGVTDNLEAHHIVRWADEPLLRVCLNNGITLCEKCHRGAHGC